MTASEMLDRLLTIATPDVLASKAISRDELGELQDELAQLIVDVANVVPGGPERLAREFPDTFGSRR